MNDYPIWPSTLPPCPVFSAIIRRVSEAGPDYVERMWAMGKARCDICGHSNDIPRHYGDWQCSQCRQSYEYEEGHAIKLTDAQWKLLRSCRWIPVSERLPEYSDDVLVCGPGVDPGTTFQTTGFFYSDDDTGWVVYGAQVGVRPDDFIPTHWMPLPPPPSA